MDVSTPLEPVADDVDRALVIRNLRKEYRPGQPVLKDISLTVEGRGMTAIIGPSGTGKSTLVRCINRLAIPPRVRSTFAAMTWSGSAAASCA